MTQSSDGSTVPARRIREGFERLSAVLRSEQWAAANAAGLNPTQASILALLESRDPVGLQIKAIADHLGVSQPTATDSVAALERKNLVSKGPSSLDSRAVNVRISAEGRTLLARVSQTPSPLETAIAGLSDDQEGLLLALLVRLIRGLQQAGTIPVQRLCVTCRHFQPYRHDDAANPHHCAFVNSAFGDRTLRLDCADHETADPALQSANWATFDTGPASLQAP